MVPHVGITMGDAAGIGPEIIVKALEDPAVREVCIPVIIGDARIMLNTAESLGSPLEFEILQNTAEIPPQISKVAIIDLHNINTDVTAGKESGATGKAAAQFIETAVRLVLAGKLDAIATAPISKKAFAMGGYDYPGHTEFLAELTNTKDFAMSFFGGELRVVLLSTHISLLDAIFLVKKENLIKIITFADRELAKLLKRRVTIAVAGLNPHASEGGMFGTEEEREIAPAIRECRERFGLDVTGPYSPDTIFLRAWRGEFDAVISCYHDQATIAVKSLAFGESVNVTLGLPIIRTSVDHGTAFDIAGKNVAESSSMRAAVTLAARLASNS